MKPLESRLSRSSPEFLINREAMLSMIADLRQSEGRIRTQSNQRRAVFAERGQIVPRDRIAMVLDPGSPWLEFSSLAGYEMHDDDGAENVSGGNLITGIGRVANTYCVIHASDSEIKGGVITPMGLRKTLRAQAIALNLKLPMINLIESGGANLAYQAEIFVEAGSMFYNMAKMSAAGIPNITLVHGSSTAGGAYIPGMSDYAIMVKDRAKVFLAGPPLVRAATGEEADDETLGGADMHSSVSGVVEYFATDDRDGARIVREIVESLGWADTAEPAPFATPKYPIDDLCGLVPTDFRKPYDVRELIARLTDGSDFSEFKARYGQMTVCGHATIGGYRCGILGNNGPIDNQGATKGAQFMHVCSQAGTPLIFLHNTTGFMVGTQAEQGGIVKHGAKMIQAVANATVPKITLLIGASFGAGNYGMSGRAFQPDFAFAWPNYRVAVMGGEQAAMVMEIVTREKLKRSGRPISEDEIAEMTRKIVERTQRESHSYYASARLWDDGIIDPRDSRNVLMLCLELVAAARTRKTNPLTFGTGRM